MEKRAEYWATDEILFINLFEGAHFDSREKIDAAFAAIDADWKRLCKKKVYCVINYTGVTVDPTVLEYWSHKRTDAVTRYSLTTVRYGADLQMRIAVRAMATRTHVPSNLYATRDEAIAVVRAIRQGTMRFDNTG